MNYIYRFRGQGYWNCQLKDNEIKSIKGKINENEKSISKLDEKIQKLDKKLSDFKGQYFLDKKITDLSSDIEDVDEDINKITAIKKEMEQKGMSLSSPMDTGHQKAADLQLYRELEEECKELTKEKMKLEAERQALQMKQDPKPLQSKKGFNKFDVEDKIINLEYERIAKINERFLIQKENTLLIDQMKNMQGRETSSHIEFEASVSIRNINEEGQIQETIGIAGTHVKECQMEKAALLNMLHDNVKTSINNSQQEQLEVLQEVSSALNTALMSCGFKIDTELKVVSGTLDKIRSSLFKYTQNQSEAQELYKKLTAISYVLNSSAEVHAKNSKDANADTYEINMLQQAVNSLMELDQGLASRILDKIVKDNPQSSVVTVLRAEVKTSVLRGA